MWPWGDDSSSSYWWQRGMSTSICKHALGGSKPNNQINFVLNLYHYFTADCSETRTLPVCQLVWECLCQCSHTWLVCLPLLKKKKKKKYNHPHLKLHLFFNKGPQPLLYLNAQQCCPGKASNKGGDVHSGLFPHKVLLVRIGLKTKYQTENILSHLNSTVSC